MKKFLSVVLSVCLLASTLTACNTSDTDWKYIEGKKEMIIGITYFEPMNYFDDSNTLVGFETEFANAVCEILGVAPKFQEISWTAKETELNAKNIDCIWNGMTITEERSTNMSISKAYMQNMQVMVVKRENADMLRDSVSGKRVVAEKTSAGEEVALSDEFFEDAQYTAVDTQAKALMEVASGTSDACVVDYVLSIGMIGEGTDYPDIVVLEDREFEKEEYGIAFRKADTELTKKVNNAIDTLIGNGKLMEIAQKYKLQDLLITE